MVTYLRPNETTYKALSQSGLGIGTGENEEYLGRFHEISLNPGVWDFPST